MIPMLPSCHASSKNVHVFDHPFPTATRFLAFRAGHTNAHTLLIRYTRGGLVKRRAAAEDIHSSRANHVTPIQFMESMTTANFGVAPLGQPGSRIKWKDVPHFLNAWYPKMAFSSRNSSSPASPHSRPLPDCLYPPKQPEKSTRAPLMCTFPARIRFATRRARSMSLELTNPDSP